MFRINLSVGDGLVVATSDHVTTSHKIDGELKLNAIIRQHSAARRMGWQRRTSTQSAGSSPANTGPSAPSPTFDPLANWRKLFVNP